MVRKIRSRIKERKTSRAVSRVLYHRSARSAWHNGVCHLTWTCVATRLIRPTLRRAFRTGTGRSHRAGIRGLSASGVHSPHVTIRLVGSYLTFSPLPPAVKTDGGCFLLHLPTLTNPFPLGSGVPCAARTFLLRRQMDASDRPPGWFSYNCMSWLNLGFILSSSCRTPGQS